MLSDDAPPVCGPGQELIPTSEETGSGYACGPADLAVPDPGHPIVLAPSTHTSTTATVQAPAAPQAPAEPVAHVGLVLALTVYVIGRKMAAVLR